MIVHKSKRGRKKKGFKENCSGAGFVNSVINKLPFELHITGYNFCGPGTKLAKRLARGDRGVNELDEACKEHDIAYNNNSELEQRHKADNVLIEKAKRRLRSADSSIGEKAAALGVTAAMKAKVKLGMGCRSKTHKKRRKNKKHLNKKWKVKLGMGCRSKTQKKKRKNKRHLKKKGKGLTFKDLTNKAKSALKNKKFLNMRDAIKIATKAVTSLKGKKKVKPIRVIPIPKNGGFLPLIPLFAALGALGSVGGGAAAIAKAVNDAKSAKELLNEKQRHDQRMESIALGKSGKGLYLKPYKKGLGLFLEPWKYQKNFQ